MHRRHRTIALSFVVGLLLAGCGSDEPSADPTTAEPVATGADSPTPSDSDPSSEASPDAGGDDWDAVVAAAEEEGFVDVDWVTNEQDVAALSALWEEDYPNIELRSRRDVSGPMAAIEEEEVAAGQAQFDAVMNADPAFLLRWQAEGRIAPIDDVPGYAALPDRFTSDGDFGFAYVGVYSLIYNTDLVSEDEVPTSVEDLLDPAWAGRVGIADPAVGAGSTKVATYVLYDALGLEFFEQLATNEPVLYDNVLNAGQAVAAGEVAVLVGGSTISVTQLGDQGAPLAVAPVTHSSPVFGAFFAYAEAEQPNAAKVFLDWIFSDEDALAYWASTARIVGPAWENSADFSEVHPAYEGLSADLVDFPALQDIADAIDSGVMDEISATLGF